jgi:putative SOS response-associated peptidase YedK
MCGKFTARYSWREVHRYSDLLTPHLTAKASDGNAPTVSVTVTGGVEETVLHTPMRMTPVVCLGRDEKRVVVPMRWGWMDEAARDPLRKPGLLHARGETADVKPTWKHAFANHRGVVFVETFNVGEDIAPGKVKQWTCRRADGRPLALAVIWERWEHPRHGAFHVYVPVTTDSPPAIHTKDDRFPVLLDSEEEVALWLGETGAPLEEIQRLVRTYRGELNVAEEERRDSSPRTTRPKNDRQPSLF